MTERLKKGMRQKMDLGNKFYDFFSHIQNLFGGPQNPPPAFLFDYFRSGYRHYFNYCRGIHRSGSAEFDFRTGCGTWFKYDCRNSRQTAAGAVRFCGTFFKFFERIRSRGAAKKRECPDLEAHNACSFWGGERVLRRRNIPGYYFRRIGFDYPSF